MQDARKKLSYRKIFFRSNIFMKQKLTFLVTFPDYFRDYRTILETFLEIVWKGDQKCEFLLHENVASEKNFPVSVHDETSQ